MSNLKILIFIISISMLASCSKSNDEKLEEQLTQKQLTNTNVDKIGQLLLMSISDFTFNKDTMIINRNGIYAIIENKIVFQYPQKFKMDITSSKLELLDISEKFLVAYDKNGLIYHDISNKETWEPKVEIPGKDISALKIINDDILIFSNNELHSLSFKNENSRKILENKFTAPYKKFYKSSLVKSTNQLCLTLGIAGKYYSNIINIKDKETKITDISATTLKNYLDQNHLYYITGKAGNWNLQKFNLTTKEKVKIFSFKELIDLEFTKWGLIVEDSNGIHLINYNGFKIIIPFDYKLSGFCKGKILISYKNKTYLVKLEDLNRKLTYIKNKKPSIFMK